MSAGAAMFRWRLAIIVAFFGAACVAAWVCNGVGASDGADATAVRATWLVTVQDFVSHDVIFAVCGALSLVAFWLRAAGEARLGSTVYGQDAGASPRVITGGPFRVMRHPLYAGTWLFYAATFAPYVPIAVLAILVVAFALCLRTIAKHEELALAQAHGDAWARYAQAVPRFVGVPGRVDDDGVETNAKAWALATLGNLALLSLGLYRIAVAAGVDFRGMRALSLLCMALWIVAVLARRVVGK